MFLFILESIGTSELILIGIIALIFLGPRKLPQIAKTIGKTMADFRNTTNEFKSTWEREVNFDEEAEILRSGELPSSATAPVPRETPQGDSNTNILSAPEIKPAQSNLFDSPPTKLKPDEALEPRSDDISEKKNWL